MDGIDTSIYGNLQQPQPTNLLGMGMQGAYMANAMNQNRMFQMQMQARQGMAELAQKHINSDGSMDYEGFGSDLFQDPRTALLAPQVLGQIYQNGLLNAQMVEKQIQVKDEQLDNMAGSLTNLLSMGDSVNQKAVLGELAAQLPYGTFTVAEAANLMHQIIQYPDQVDGQGNVIGNPALGQFLRTFSNQFENARAAQNNFVGTWQSITTPQGTYGGFSSPVTGNFTPTTQFGQGEPQTMTDTAGGKSIVPLGNVPGFTGGGVQQIPQPGNPFTQPSAAGPTGQAPGVAPGQVQSGGIAPPPGPNANPQDVDKAVLMLFRRESGNAANPYGLNVPTSAGPGGAFGYGQIQPPTWKEGLQLAGMDPNLDIRKTNFGQQFEVARALYLKYGERPWAASHNMSGPLPQGQIQPQGQTPEQMASAVPGSATMAPNLSQSQFAGARQEQAALQQQLAGEPQAQAGAQTPAPTPTAPPLSAGAQPQVAPAQPQGQAPQQASGYTFTPQEQQALGMTPGQKVVLSLPPIIEGFLKGDSNNQLAEYEREYQSTQATDNQANMTMNNMNALKQEFQSGRGETAFAEIARVADSLGMDKSLVNSIARGDLDAIQAFQKSATINAVNVARVTEGPNSKLTNMISGAFFQTQPNLEMTEGAITRMFNFMGKIQQLHNMTYQAWTEERNRMQAAAQQNGSWTPQMIARLQNFPAAFEQGLISSGVVNFNFDSPNLLGK